MLREWNWVCDEREIWGLEVCNGLKEKGDGCGNPFTRWVFNKVFMEGKGKGETPQNDYLNEFFCCKLVSYEPVFI